MKRLLLLIALASPNAISLFAGNYFSSPSQPNNEEQEQLKKIAEEQKRKEKEAAQIKMWTEQYGKKLVDQYLQQFEGRAHTVVHELVLQNGIEQDDLLEEYPHDIHHPDLNNKTPLALAAQMGNFDAVVALLNLGADPNGFVTTNIDGIHTLNDTDDMSISMYLSPEENIQKRREYWAAPLYFASEGGFLEIAQLLISNDETALDASTDYNESSTPLHVAKNAQMAYLLLNAGAKKNARDNNGWSPLHRALFDERFDVVQLLVENYEASDFKVQITLDGQEQMMSALEMAEYFGYQKVAEIIRNSSAYQEL